MRIFPPLYFSFSHVFELGGIKVFFICENSQLSPITFPSLKLILKTNADNSKPYPGFHDKYNIKVENMEFH